MHESTVSLPVPSARNSESPSAEADPRDSHAIKEEILPFTVRLVRSEDDLSKAVRIRHSAYARHLPAFAQTLRSAEAADTDDGVVVILAESKLDGSPLGTMRIQTNAYEPLCLEQSVVLPDWLRSRRLAEATRLGVTVQRVGRLVANVLFKAFYLHCHHIGTEWMVVAGRYPMDRHYARLLFEDVYPEQGFVPLSHASNLPHRVMMTSVGDAQARWAAARHPLFDFAFKTHHPDIHVGGPRTQHDLAAALRAHPVSVPVLLM